MLITYFAIFVLVEWWHWLLSYSIELMSYDRVLPKPPALYYDSFRGDSSTHTTTPFQHKIMADVPQEDGRRSTALELRAQRPTASQASSVQASPMMSSKRPQVTDVAAVLASPLPRKRTISLMSSEPTREERSASASSSRSSSSRDSGLQFCLCQPEPKIPRPPNGSFGSFHLFAGPCFV